MASLTDGNWSRVNDLALGFGIHRFTHGGRGISERVLWRLEITRHVGQRVVETDVSVADLRAIANWCLKAIETIQSDGGRIGEEDSPVVECDEAEAGR